MITLNLNLMLAGSKVLYSLLILALLVTVASSTPNDTKEMDLLNPNSDPLALSNIRNVLIRLEDTIIFSLIERAQFSHNPKLYTPGAFKELSDHGFNGSYLDWFLKETETIHAKMRRYESPDEYPFTPRDQLPQAILPPLNYPTILYTLACNLNANDKIKGFYVNDLLPALTERSTASFKNTSDGNDDGNYGSSATRDVESLQAMSRRIHYGMFVSESKFKQDPAAFIPHIKAKNWKELENLIYKPEVEAALLVRLRNKALTYGQDITSTNATTPTDGSNENMKINADDVVKLYKDHIIPLTKDVEVEYLLRRLDGLSEQEINELESKKK